jgi:hypothetical protein
LIYREVVSPPLWLWAIILFFAGSFALAFGSALGAAWGIGSLAFAVVMVTWLLLLTRLRIEVGDGILRAGRARLPLHFTGEVLALTGEQARRKRGVEADPAAFLALRGWVTSAVVVENIDTDDPVPYWFISTRKPTALSQAILDARQTS